ncbi:MAG: hypothetical protein H0Z32_07950 [Bacillaceae bacterium]|nr:hypothetical protein [Bacillaceae bacterium]
MHEYAGECSKCGKMIFQVNVFLDGVSERGTLLCYECAAKEFKQNEERLKKPQTRRES